MSLSTVFSICMAVVLSTQKADGYEHSMESHCLYSSKDPHEFIQQYVYNKIENLRFNSSKGLFEGYTEFGLRQAKHANDDPATLAGMKAQLESVCKPNIELYYSAILGRTVEPSVRLSSVTPSSGRHPALLMCSAYDFYPQRIKVTWKRDGQDVTSDVTSTEQEANGDWYYQIHSHLEYTPRSGEKISCMVEHPSLYRPLVVYWDPSLPESERNKIAIGASGLVLGLVLALAGLIYYQRKKSNGRMLVPAS